MGTNLEEATLIIFVCCSNFSFAAEPLQSVDALSLDIAGVKLGISQAEAIKAITSTLKIKKTDLKFDSYPPVNIVTGAKDPKYFIVQHGVSKISVYLIPNAINPKSSSQVVNLIIYEMPWTTDNVNSMKKSAISKYGNPSFKMGDSYQWCLDPKNIHGCPAQGPTLKYYSTKLKLHDLKYNEALVQFRDKQQSSKPVF